MAQIKSHRDLIAWQKTIDFVVSVYDLVAHFPPDERFALSDQLRRASVSAAANIAEGHGRSTRRDYRHFVGLSYASLMECDALLVVAQRVEHVTPEQCFRSLGLLDECSRLVNRLRQSLQD
jgi:four helix bundle protein